MTLGITVALNEARLAGTLDWLNLGSGVAHIEIYGTTRPGTTGGDAGGPPLVALPLADPAGVVAANALTLAAGADTLVASSGTAAWARIKNGNGDTGLDCDVTDEAGTGEVRLPSTTLYAGGITRIVSAVFG